jgi:very-short-patch-repair endonuclease
MPPVQPAQAANTEESVQTEAVRRGLENIRKRLLDLTNRNKLISYRHSKSSLRVVDVQLEAIFDDLIGEKKLPFVHVPEPPRELVANLGEKPSAKDFAAQVGWCTDFDLASDGGQAACLPLLQYQEDLETLIRKIGTAARTAIEESGANLLHLVFGFLEWTESEDSKQPRYAPLIVVPVALIMPRAGEPDRSIRLQYTGEDLSTNLSLVEKMRRDFGLDIPTLEENETPTAYFERFAPILKQKRDWRICNQIALGLLSFGKLLMYLDLDAERWPKDTKLLQHPRLSDLFNGNPSEGLSFATEFDIDDESDRVRDVPPLICDADSSQHSALIDAARGMNLVIEGPPGTGKSQTITNLIAATIAKGKRVLFVAEKMAALNVVKRRLDDYGLGDFCLELHSHKTNKVGLLKSLEARIQATPTFASPSTLSQKQDLLDAKRVELTRYVKLLNAPFGAIGRTPFELIWQRDSVFSSAWAMDAPTSSAIAFQEAVNWEYRDVQERRDAVSSHAAHMNRFVTSGGQLQRKGNIWGWLPNADLSQVQQQKLLNALPQLHATFSRKVELAHSLLQEIAAAPDDWSSLSHSQSTWSGQMTTPPDDLLPDTLPALVGQESRGNARRLFETIVQYEQIVSFLPGGDQFLDSDVKDAYADCDASLIAFGLPAYSLGSLRELIEKYSEARRCLDRTRRASSDLALALGVETTFTFQGLGDLIASRALIATAPLHVAHLRGNRFAQDGLVHFLEGMQRECAALNAEAGALAEHLILDGHTSIEQLEQSALVLETTPWYARWTRSFRESSSIFATHSRSNSKRSRRQKATALRYIAGIRRKMEAFSAHAECKRRLGEDFIGVKTDWADLITVANWHDQVFARLPEHRPFASQLRTALLTLPSTRLKAVVNMSIDQASQLEEMPHALELLIAIQSRISGAPFDSETADISSFLDGVVPIVECAERLLKHLSPMRLPDSTSRTDLLSIFGKLQDARKLRDVANHDAAAERILGKHFKGISTPTSSLVKTLEFAQSLSDAELPSAIKSWLFSREGLTRLLWLRRWMDEYGESEAKIGRAQSDIFDATGSSAPFPTSESMGSLTEAVDVIERCADSGSLLSLWIDLKRSARRLYALKLEHLAELSEGGNLEAGSAVSAFDYFFCDSLLKRLFHENPDLWQLTGVSHEEVRAQFSELDRSIIRMNRSDIAYRASKRIIPHGVRGTVVKETTDLALINHEISKQRAHIPIRQLMRRAGRAVQGLKPCFMMSPMSIAQFLEPGSLGFDLIVMDEASQLRPEDALGAIVRGAQVVVVGDPKQLPPTSFFQRTLDDESEEDEDKSSVSEGESILDIALGLYQPVRRLRWHYRSQHHSLIAFSNSEFYDDNLVVFPSAYHEHPALGVKYVGAKGLYDNRRNPIEAETVVEAILEHILQHPSDSLGVVTMNFEQRELIEELLDMRLKQDSYARGWIEQREGSPEPFFIKNLENVQGDERDVIFISVTYGPDSQGNHFQRFSGVNTSSGQRRLNVLITRAKKRTVVFSSLDPDMIRAETNTPWGVRALKGYLNFAKNGITARPEISPGAEASNEHEAAVGSVLKAQGYDVVPQIGVSGYFIDLAVRHPQKPGAFLLGIEFDGKSYHSGRSARDRDRLRQMTLENQGWKIHRIWSTDWFKNRNGEIERLLQRVRALELESRYQDTGLVGK